MNEGPSARVASGRIHASPGLTAASMVSRPGAYPGSTPYAPAGTTPPRAKWIRLISLVPGTSLATAFHILTMPPFHTVLITNATGLRAASRSLPHCRRIASTPVRKYPPSAFTPRRSDSKTGLTPRFHTVEMCDRRLLNTGLTTFVHSHRITGATTLLITERIALKTTRMTVHCALMWVEIAAHTTRTTVSSARDATGRTTPVMRPICAYTGCTNCHAARIAVLTPAHTVCTIDRNVSLCRYATTTAATSAPIAMITRPIGFAVNTKLSAVCAAAQAMVAIRIANITPL